MTNVFTSVENTKGEMDLFINGKRVLKGWESYTGWYWFATEKIQKQDSVIKGKVYKNDQIWNGLVQPANGCDDEWGDFSETELKLLSPRVWKIPKRNLHYSGRRD